MWIINSTEKYVILPMISVNIYGKSGLYNIMVSGRQLGQTLADAEFLVVKQ